MGKENATQSPLQLIMTMDIIASWSTTQVIQSVVSVASSYMHASAEDEQTEECDAAS